MAAQQTPKARRHEKANFSADTQLFRELGELLVGRDATALLELVKNSYDADARVVIVDGRDLDSRRGEITIRDDGNGMTLAQFRQGFLRLGGRGKSSGTRRSPRYGRRYTGEKGVGRLATHKLADRLALDSVPRSSSRSRRAVSAEIDWTALERVKDLAKAGRVVEVTSYPAGEQSSGTEITLSGLRHAWTKADLNEFVSGAFNFSPPDSLLGSKRIQALMKPAKPLFRAPMMRDRSGGERHDPGFRVHLEGDFAFGGDFWDEMTETVEWVLEISAERRGVRIAVAPTARELKLTDGGAHAQSVKVAHPNPKIGPFFQARIFVRARGGTKAFRQWSEQVAGVRVYSEGFRVLPYGESDNDWLQINRDYATRKRKLRVFEGNEELAAEMGWTDEDRDLALTLLPADSYLGAIFLTRERSGNLEMLVNREGFVANEAFENLVTLTQLGVSVLVRARAAGRVARRQAAKTAREEGDSSKGTAANEETGELESAGVRAGTALRDTRNEVAELRTEIASGATEKLEPRIERLEEQTDRLESAFASLVKEQRLTPILASVGTQMGEFVHEINGLLSMASTIDTVLGRLRENPDNFPSREARRQAGEIQQTVGDLRARLERQATYLIDLTAPGAMRRRSRQRIAERFERTVELLEPVIERRRITVVNRIPSELRTPAMFPAELTAVFLNMLTNAVKAAGEGGRIVARASDRSDGSLQLRIENTGAAVDLSNDPEQWFLPFETTTSEVDPLLGQGMGFGLPISRDILDEYGASIAFAKPRKGFKTAIEIGFPA